ncbi:FlgB family protein [Sulfitobacter delicatus]|uniref:Flagellar basal-body rod protein FlgB n=1 Tax=Sulfitobacter delicatus TaxID=218672 RepID=A0A1G7I9N0_9RHOB|nr:FlgB family protein [Sulfitobacter delicatus]SDF09431.1 flagellar basal-body rod protein FlgB [Sulfitobacter delicatus]
MFEKLELFRMATAMATHAGQRQAVAAQNVANADTPGYQARDLPKFQSIYRPADAPATARATRDGHLHGAREGAVVAAAFVTGEEAAPNGNSVSLETEMLKSVDAKRQHDRALAIYKSGLNILRSTIRG